MQQLRAVLCWEPRGHADMHGGFLVPPDDDGAHLGMLFWHEDAFEPLAATIASGARCAAPARRHAGAPR